jgi:uracil-DNA glycosylase
MDVSHLIKCDHFRCTDVDTGSYALPSGEIDGSIIRVLMITEAPPAEKADYFYADDSAFHLQIVLQAFNDAGVHVTSMHDIIDRGIYITTAIKCGKTHYSVSAETIKECSILLEKEVDLFPNISIYMLMGDIAIRAMNYIWEKRTGQRVIPTGSTYKIRANK